MRYCPHASSYESKYGTEVSSLSGNSYGCNEPELWNDVEDNNVMVKISA